MGSSDELKPVSPAVTAVARLGLEAVDLANHGPGGFRLDAFEPEVLPLFVLLQELPRQEVTRPSIFSGAWTYGCRAFQAKLAIEVRVPRAEHSPVDGDFVPVAELDGQIGPFGACEPATRTVSSWSHDVRSSALDSLPHSFSR